jgi:fatty acid desaturase
MNTNTRAARVEFNDPHQKVGTNPDKGHSPYTGDDVGQLWRYMASTGERDTLQRLHARSPWRGILALASDWGLVSLSVAAAVKFGILLVPLALVIIGSRQRALVVLAHEGAHRALHPNREINDILAKYFACLPMFLDYSVFCRRHAEHHRYLGDPHKDTDFLHSEEDMSRGWWYIYRKQLFSFDNWLAGGLLGGLRSAPWSQKCWVAAWWCALIGIITMIFSMEVAFIFTALWFVARAVIHHATISFVIISDHVGLRPGASILNFARNHSHASPFRWLIHPHSNGFHLTHHLLPGLPFYSLASADRLLMKWPSYRQAVHCTSYFFGKNSAIRSWCGQRPDTNLSGDLA